MRIVCRQSCIQEAWSFYFASRRASSSTGTALKFESHALRNLSIINATEGSAPAWHYSSRKMLKFFASELKNVIWHHPMCMPWLKHNHRPASLLFCALATAIIWEVSWVRGRLNSYLNAFFCFVVGAVEIVQCSCTAFKVKVLPAC